MRVVLDTNIVRGFGAAELDRSGFLSAIKSGITFHLSDPAMCETIAALHSRRLPWDQWVRARSVLSELLDKREPILLGGGEGLSRAGIRVGNPRSLQEIENAEKANLAGWKMLMKASMRRPIERTRIRCRSRRSIYQLNVPAVRVGIEEEKKAWVDDFAEFERKLLEKRPDIPSILPTHGDSEEALSAFMEVVADKLRGASVPEDGPNITVRLDAFLRVQSLLRLRAIRSKNPYNAVKDANDAFDHSLLRYLALPAAVCTNDGGIFADVSAAKSWQIAWIITPDDLKTPEVIERLKELDWPDERRITRP